MKRRITDINRMHSEWDGNGIDSAGMVGTNREGHLRPVLKCISVPRADRKNIEPNRI